MQDYRKLRVWRHAHDLAIAIRSASRTFPSNGYSSLQSQMVRAAESIVFNVAEGCGASSQREFARFLGISIKSTFELQAECDLAKDYAILSIPAWEQLTAALISVRRMLFALRKKVLFPMARGAAEPATVNSQPSTNHLSLHRKPST
jgi:four helix bundle protein